MTEYEMIKGMWDVFGQMSTSRYDLLGSELYDAIMEYLYEDCDEDCDEECDVDVELPWTDRLIHWKTK